MMEKLYFITKDNFRKVIVSLTGKYNTYAPVHLNNERYYEKITEHNLDSIVTGEIRPVESIKSFYFKARSKAAEYFNGRHFEEKDKPFLIIGAKSCDLNSFNVMEYVFTKEPFKDPFYISQKENSVIISSDCTIYGETCFCVALNIMPYPTVNFDINISELEQGYLLEIGTQKGRALIEDFLNICEDAEPYIEKRDIKRNRLKEDLLEHVKKSNIPGHTDIQKFFKSKFDSGLWEETAKTCVECGACNVICPMCHCFVLKDEAKEGSFERLKLWDSCLLLSFARVAGGANPRKLLSQRLRNRFDKKFNFFPDVMGKFGCTGCGRCSEACPGKIDIRNVLSKLQ